MENSLLRIEPGPGEFDADSRIRPTRVQNLDRLVQQSNEIPIRVSRPGNDGPGWQGRRAESHLAALAFNQRKGGVNVCNLNIKDDMPSRLNH